MIQEIITYCIVAGAVLVAVYRIFKNQFSSKKTDGCNACEGGDKCAACPLRDMQSLKEKK